MTTAVALARSDVPDTVPEMMQVARFLANSALMPEHLHEDPASLFAVMLKARALNIPMSTAFDHVTVQDGNTGLAASLMQALVIRAGYQLFLAHQDDEQAIVRAVREGIGPNGEGVAMVKFSLADAVKAELITLVDGKVRARSQRGKTMPWEKYTADMLVWRAISRACRFYFSDVLLGMVYTPEELGAEVDGEGRPVRVDTVRVDVLADDVKAAILRVNRAEDEPALRALYAEFEAARLLSELVPDGRTLSQYLADKKAELDKKAKAAARAAKKAAPAETPPPPAAEDSEPPNPPYVVGDIVRIEGVNWRIEDFYELDGQPVVGVVETKYPSNAQCWAVDTLDQATLVRHRTPKADETDEETPDPVVSEPDPDIPESGFDALTPTPEPSAPDTDTEDTPRRKAVLKYAADHFGHADTAEEAAVEQFGRPLDTIGTPQLQEWLADVRKADH